MRHTEAHHGHDHARDHGHEHHHDHGHHHRGHAHGPASFDRAFLIGIGLNLAFVAIEAAYGVLGNSLALLADAGHNMSDVLGLVIAWGGSVLARRRPTARFTYGLRGSSILAALFNALILLMAIGAIAWEAVQRLSDPQPVAGGTVMLVAAIGILVNGATALLFMAGRKGDINIRGAFLHMVADAAISAGVVAAGALVYFSGLSWIDPLVSLAVSAVILWGTWGLLRDSVAMSLDSVPAGIDPAAVRRYIESRPGVSRLHDLHVWPMSTTETALTCHLVMPGGHPGDAFLSELTAELKARFGIDHPTVQIETSEDTLCALSPDHVV